MIPFLAELIADDIPTAKEVIEILSQSPSPSHDDLLTEMIDKANLTQTQQLLMNLMRCRRDNDWVPTFDRLLLLLRPKVEEVQNAMVMQMQASSRNEQRQEASGSHA